MTARDEYGNRTIRVGTSVFMIGVGGLMFCVNVPKSHSPFLPLGIYFLYLLSTAVVLSLIAGRLYKHHEVREYKIDLATIFLFMALAAIPLGVANSWVRFLRQYVEEDIGQDLTAISIMASIGLYILIIPILIITETIWHFWRNMKRRD